MAAAIRGCQARTIRKRGSTSSAPATRRRRTRAWGGKGDNLFTCALVALNVDTGKMAWYYQMSPHDTHDWDTAQNPMLIDATINGKPRKLVSVAARNGYFFTVDRVTGEHIATTKYGTHTNWAGGLNSTNGSLARSREGSDVPGALVSPVEGGDDELAAACVFARHRPVLRAGSTTFNMLYLTDPDPRGSMGLGGKTACGGRLGRQVPHGHRARDRQGRLAAPVCRIAAAAASGS